MQKSGLTDTLNLLSLHFEKLAHLIMDFMRFSLVRLLLLNSPTDHGLQTNPTHLQNETKCTRKEERDIGGWGGCKVYISCAFLNHHVILLNSFNVVLRAREIS